LKKSSNEIVFVRLAVLRVVACSMLFEGCTAHCLLEEVVLPVCRWSFYLRDKCGCEL